jgi:hypothetical protein
MTGPGDVSFLGARREKERVYGYNDLVLTYNDPALTFAKSTRPCFGALWEFMEEAERKSVSDRQIWVPAGAYPRPLFGSK